MYALHTIAAPQGFRPIRVWGALARQNRVAVKPSEVVHILRESFLSVVRFGSVVPATSLWMDQAGTIQIVSPDQDGGFTSPAWCMEGLGLMSCELLSGVAMPDSISPQVALYLAKTGAETAPGGWDPALGFVLQRMLGQLAPYQSVHEALKELDEFYREPPVPAIAHTSGRIVEGESYPPTLTLPARTWAVPALMGGAAASLLFLVGGGAFWLGTKRAQPAAAAAVAPAPPPAVSAVLTLDPTILDALKKIGQASSRTPEPRERPREVAAPARPAAQVGPTRVIVPEDDEPVFVGTQPRRDQSPSGVVAARVKTGDFIARR